MISRDDDELTVGTEDAERDLAGETFDMPSHKDAGSILRQIWDEAAKQGAQSVYDCAKHNPNIYPSCRSAEEGTFDINVSAGGIFVTRDLEMTLTDTGMLIDEHSIGNYIALLRRVADHLEKL